MEAASQAPSSEWIATMSAVVARILDRLGRVKATGAGRWLACCPAHEDRSPSLSIREVDGRILVHCFAGCEIEDVLGALGCQLSDLFEEPLAQQVCPTNSRIPAADILQALDHEMVVASLILGEVIERRRIGGDQLKRLGIASARIGAARDMVCPARVRTHA